LIKDIEGLANKAQKLVREVEEHLMLDVTFDFSKFEASLPVKTYHGGKLEPKNTTVTA